MGTGGGLDSSAHLSFLSRVSPPHRHLSVPSLQDFYPTGLCVGMIPPSLLQMSKRSWLPVYWVFWCPELLVNPSETFPSLTVLFNVRVCLTPLNLLFIFRSWWCISLAQNSAYSPWWPKFMVILLPQLSYCWDCGHGAPCSAISFCSINVVHLFLVLWAHLKS